jgi:hypothetical protein
MLGTFFPPENVRNFHNRPESGVFLWWKAEQYNQENRKEKKSTMVMSSFLSTLLFFSFVLTCSLFFILVSMCRPSSIRETILRGVHMLPVHLCDYFFCFSYKYQKKGLNSTIMDVWTVDPSLYKIEKYFLYELECEIWFQNESKWMIQSIEYESKINWNIWCNYWINI